MKGKYLKFLNGWIGFAVGTLLFFAAPPLYRQIDPTAGQFDAGYIHPLIYSFTVLSFSIGCAWLSLKLTAPGLHKLFDNFLEQDSAQTLTDSVRSAFWLFFFYIICVIAIVISVV